MTVVRRLALAMPPILLLAWGLHQYLLPVPAVAPVVLVASRVVVPGSGPAIPWPAAGAAAVAAGDLGLIAQHGDTSPAPIWSMAKVMTAAIVLKDHPLQPGATGPTLTVTAADVADYESLLSRLASTVPVAEGERITEYQALQALLVPSGNNIADLLARWVSGSVPAFVDRMNAQAQAVGMTATHFADPAGFEEQTVGVPADLVRLGRLEMGDPVFAQIVGQTEVTLPVAGRMLNFDRALGQHGIIGIKTGSAPGVSAGFLFDARTQVAGRPVDIVGVVMGVPSLPDAFAASGAIVDAVSGALRVVRVTTAYDVVARYRAVWGDTVTVRSPADVDLLALAGSSVTVAARVRDLRAPTAAGTVVGGLTITLGDQQRSLALVTSVALDEPDLRWRLLRPPG